MCAIYSKQVDCAKDFMEYQGLSISKITDLKELYNLDNEIEALCLEFDNKGYVIININNYEIPEFSANSKQPYDNDKGVNYYNGPLEYYSLVDSEDILKHLKSNEEIKRSDLKLKYKKQVEPEEQIDSNINTGTTDISIALARSQRYNELDSSLVTYSSPYYCGVDACAILLKYMDDNYSESFIPFNKESNITLQGYLNSEYYIKNASTSARDLVSGDLNYSGLGYYIVNHGLSSSFDADYSTYSFSDIMDFIDDDKPVIVGTENHPSPDFTEHWVIAHGYNVVFDQYSYIIVNDGFGNNNVNITSESQYYDNIVYIE